MSKYLRRESAVEGLESKGLLAGKAEFGPPPAVPESA